MHLSLMSLFAPFCEEMKSSLFSYVFHQLYDCADRPRFPIVSSSVFRTLAVPLYSQFPCLALRLQLWLPPPPRLFLLLPLLVLM
jgi:hypothetical protein